MPPATPHTFKTRDPVDRYSEQLRFYIELRGKDYHPAMPIPRTSVSDCRQIATQWSEALIASLPTLQSGIATAWRAIVKQWQAAVERLHASELDPNDVYDDNPGFWLALRKLSAQLGALDQVITRDQVLVWAVKDTVREHAEAIQEHAEAVYQAGRAATNAVADAAGAIPTLAKALAIGAIGLGVHAIIRR